MSDRLKSEMLQKKSQDIRNQAYREHRTLTTEEQSLIRELEVEAAEYRGVSLTFPSKVRAASASGPFKSLGEQLQAIQRAGTPGGETDPRLHQVRAATGLSEGVPSDGGFLLAPQFSYDLLGGAFETGILASRCNRFTISGNANSIKLPAIDETSRATGSRWGGVRSYWLDEAAEKQKSKPKFRSLELSLNKNVVLIYATDELLQDASVLERVVRQAATDEIGFAVDNAIINGTGAGQPLGILNSGCLVTVSKEVGQSGGFLLENAVKMFARMPARNRRNACFYISQSVEPALYTMSLSVGTGGGPVFLPAGGASAAPYGTLLGRPIIPIEQCPSLGTVGDVIFADMSSYILADKGAIESAVSIHVQFIFDESVFRFVYRVDGQPLYSSAITGFDGISLSPFVALESR